MQILQHLPRKSWHRGIARSFTALFGFMLTFAGIVAGAPALLFVIILFLTLLKGSSPAKLFQDGASFFVVCGVVSIACLYFGRRLIQGKRRLVLFLRRFGFHKASQALTFAVSCAFGRRWRLVTLDDAEIAPLGVSLGKRRMAQAGKWLFSAVLVIAVLYVVMWILGDDPDRIIRELFNDIMNSSRSRGDNLFASLFVAVIGTLVGALVILSISLGLMLLGVALSASATLFSWNTWRQVRKAERSKALLLTEERRIPSILSEVVDRTKRTFAARLTVLRVSGLFWQKVVRALSQSADAVVVDISLPSANLLWEIETLKQMKGVICVYVGERRRVVELGNQKGDGRGDVRTRLKALLENEAVIAYEAESKAAMRWFVNDLAAYLESPVSK